ncbi:unnamed protein product [Clonostachys rosea f. rosea IK726]|uniref:Uncharacterized protein n=1 Tax=Clonostachys rosea f. rosea IK726 TaxID=1349383 RepID=A0ACA9T953_BIOOC|nr:unnamed protein product [Clonostachys rosea f. rosea IK726]
MLDLTHDLWRLTLHGSLAKCPQKDKANRVLDLGTGTGIWAIEFADEHADAELIGVDRMPIQSSWLPPNLSFEIDNVEDTWTWAKPFDYIFCRAMIGSIENWPRLIKQAFKHLEPGGWLEWSQLIVEATDRTGRSVTVAPNFKKMMEDAGFEEVEETQVKLPINSWAKTSGTKY